MKPRRAAFAARVVHWQRRHGRSGLPWQASRDPYRVWLSEVMLQQTQVATVLGYYERFLERYPDVGALARAPLDDVLAAWSGLGYYSRARHLHRCAQEVAQQHGGVFPRRAGELARLPGIGRSTAAAIAVFCHGEREAILDGNVKRVLSRAMGFDRDLASATNEKLLWHLAAELLPHTGIEAYTQGLMDLGATVCVPREPDCARCPLAQSCVARAQGRQAELPVRSARPRRTQVSSLLLWLTHRRRVWLVRRPSPGIWAGLWSLPEVADRPALQALTAGWPGRSHEPPALVHALTHRDWTLQPVRWQWPAVLGAASRRGLEAGLPAGRWFEVEEALGLGLPAPVRRWLQAGDD